MFWGGDKEDLEEMVVSQQCRCDIDYIFNVIYIDSTLQLENVFKSYVKSLFQGQKNIQKTEKDNLQKCIKELNTVISNMKAMHDFQGELSREYKKYRDEQLEIKIKSEVEMDNVYSKLVPYISNKEDNTYPTSGDGRKKIVEYSLLSMQSREIEKTKVNIFLIEELENHLHRSLQISLSFQLFEDCLFKHMFITTHSSLVVSRMDNVNLIKLYMKSKPIGCSINYKVPTEYKKNKSKLNEGLSEAIFAEKVLLVEGPSEKILFERVMLDICPKYECTGKFILPVDGVSFKVYYDILTNLGIKCIVKTDNDLKYITDKNEIELSGINRCADIAKVSELPKWKLKNKRTKVEFEKNKKIWKRNFYSYFSKIINQLSNKYINLSHIDLENDLYDVIPSTMQKYVDLNKGKLHPIDYLQNAKQNRMVELCEVISSDDAKRIYNHEYFRCLKELLKND